MREWINKHPLQVWIAAAVAVAIVVTVLTVYFREAPPVGYYYYDLKKQALFEVDPAAVGPRPAAADIKAPDGGEAARAFVYSCGRCSSGEQYIGYLESYSEEARTAAAKLRGAFAAEGEDDLVAPAAGAEGEAPKGPMQVEELITRGRRVAKPAASPEWVEADSPEGAKIVTDAVSQCDGKPPRQCSR